MENQTFQTDLSQDAISIYKAKITDMNRIREMLEERNPEASEQSIDNAMVKLKAYRKSEGFKLLIIGAILLFAGILAFLMFSGGIIIMALIGALIGGGLGGLIKGFMEYTKN